MAHTDMRQDPAPKAGIPPVPTVFISYSSMDRAFARQLAEDLSAMNVEVWIDERQVEVGDVVGNVLAAGLAQADWVVTILSRHSFSSPWVQREVNAALERELRSGLTIILPIRIDDHQVPLVLSERVFADFRGDYGSALSSLANAIENRPRGAVPKSESKPPRQAGLGVIAPESIPHFIDRLRDEHLHIRLSAVSVLRTAVPDAAEALTVALDDAEPAVRLVAVAGLTECGPAGFDGLLKASYDNDRQVGTSALMALGRMGPKAIARCIEVLNSSKDETVKMASISSLQMIGRDSIPALISAIRNSAHREFGHYRVYDAATEALGTFASESDEALSALIKEVENPAGFEQVFATMRALGALGPRAEAAIPALVELSTDFDFDHRMKAKDALIKIVGDERYGKSDWSA